MFILDSSSPQIFVSNEQQDVDIDLQSVRRLVVLFLQMHKISTDQVYIYFLTDADLAQLHDEQFSDPSLTDTITLPIDKPGDPSFPHVLGEAFVSPKAAMRFLGQYTKSQLYHEISRYVVHSLLHMLGYDDQTDEDKQIMRAQEDSSLDFLAQNQALLQPTT
ncbi:putative rRNA maturation factor [Chlamydia suis MD56]|uniref:rRNA maturation RNase YbeY n=1 Tax=Chlamydia suis TaxID=83559 RepID=UPI0003BFF868|nr:rRNA maturation RNase YbeY [Chlamydia suis]ESN89425.1 putative rRNA maturation factor [Chlamydia suis MD56]